MSVRFDGRATSSEAAEAVAEEIRAAGGEAQASGADVADPAQVEEMVAAAVDRWDKVDESRGLHLPRRDWTPEKLLEHWREIGDPAGQTAYPAALEQTRSFLLRAAETLGLDAGALLAPGGEG